MIFAFILKFLFQFSHGFNLIKIHNYSFFEELWFSNIPIIIYGPSLHTFSTWFPIIFFPPLKFITLSNYLN